MRDAFAPLEFSRLLQAGDEPELIHREIGEDAEILELGCGSGRITHPLIALGHRVVAVDFNPEMLELIEGAETVEARIQDLDLHRTFGCVLMMSNLINNHDPSERLALLRACRRHVAPNGVVLIERYDPASGEDPTPVERERLGMTVRVRDIRREGNRLYQVVEWDAGSRGHWTFNMDGARILSDDEVLADLAAANLRLIRWIDDPRRWFSAAPV